MGDARAGGRAALYTALLVIAAAPGSPSAADSCDPWPGEPAPLPTVAARDAALARWAELRVTELVARAQLAESADVLESHRLWRRVLCLDPTNQLAWRGLDRTRAVRVYRPELRWGDAPAPASSGDAWDGLAVPVVVVRARPLPPPPVVPEPEPRRTVSRPEPPPKAEPDEREQQQALAGRTAAEQALAGRSALERAQDLLEQGDERMRSARFEEALGQATAARQALDGLPPHADLEPLRARAEVLAATAQVALGDDVGARQSFTRALAADPSLNLDPMNTSPKVMRVLEDARSEDRSP